MYRLIVVCLISLIVVGAQEESNLTLSKLINKFQIHFFKELTKQKDGNVFCSGFSLSTALSMLLAGARGDTASEIKTTLGYHNETDNQIQESYRHLLTILNGNHSGYDLTVANSLWLQQGFNVLQSYKDIMQRDFFAQEENVNFANSLATDQINQWASNKTKGKIPKLFDNPLGPETRLVLANAVYFKGAWAHPFMKDFTEKKAFHINGSGESVQADMMPMTRRLRHKDSPDLNAQLLELPYQDSEASMIIILPKENIGLGAVESSLTVEKLEKAISELKEEDVTLLFPKFNVSSTIHLDEILKAMGVKKIFEDADFSGMTQDPSLFVSDGTQKAVVEVNEEGTVAAVITDFVVALSANPDEVFFIVNKPFLFVIRQNANRLNLFMGKVVNPLN